MPDVVGGAVTESEWVSVGRSQIAVIKAGQPQASIKGARVQAQLALELKKAKECKAAAAKLWRKCYREAEQAGFEQNGELVHGSPFQPAKKVMMAAAKLGEIAFEARKVGGACAPVEREAVRLSHRALVHAKMLERSDLLEREWHARQLAMPPMLS